MKSFKAISFYKALTFGFFISIVLFALITSIIGAVSVFFPKAAPNIKFLDDIFNHVLNFLLGAGLSLNVAEKIAICVYAALILCPGLVFVPYFSKYKEIRLIENKLFLMPRFNNVPVEISTDGLTIEINKFFEITGRANLSGDLFKEVEYIGTIYPVKIKSSGNSWRVFITSDALKSLRKNFSESAFVEKNINKKLVWTIFFIVVIVILSVFFKNFYRLIE